MIDFTKGELREQILFSRKNKDTSLINCINKLKKFHGDNSIANSYIYFDFAPRSFYYVHRHDEGEFLESGGIIYNENTGWHIVPCWWIKE